MALDLSDVHCPHCGKKLCERMHLKPGSFIDFNCPRCDKPVHYEEGLPKAGKPNE